MGHTHLQIYRTHTFAGIFRDTRLLLCGGFHIYSNLPRGIHSCFSRDVHTYLLISRGKHMVAAIYKGTKFCRDTEEQKKLLI